MFFYYFSKPYFPLLFSLLTEFLGDATLHLVSIARIALNVFAFTISCIVMACFVSIPLILKNHIDSLNGELGPVLFTCYKNSFDTLGCEVGMSNCGGCLSFGIEHGRLDDGSHDGLAIADDTRPTG